MAIFSSSPSQQKPAPKRPDHRVFTHPDPYGIFLGTTRLDHYLKGAGITKPFIIRDLLSSLDWSAFEERYGRGGRAAYAPQAMVGVILYGLTEGASSLRELERLARANLECMWVSGGIAPDHSVLGRFIYRHQEVLEGLFFESLTREVLKKTHSGTRHLAGDGTVVEAASSRYKLLTKEAAELEAERASQRAQSNPSDKGLQEKAEQAKEVVETIQERQQKRKDKGKKTDYVKASAQEPEAMVQPLKNSKDRAPSYKPSVLANEKRVVVAFDVDPSNETKVIAGMLDRVEGLGLGAVKELLLDAGYCIKDILNESLGREISLLCPEGQSKGDGPWTKKVKAYYPKSAFEYDEASDTYLCPGGQRLFPKGRWGGNAKNPAVVTYETDGCLACPHRGRCTRSETGRKVKRYEWDELKEAQREVMKHPKARARYRKRQAMVESVFSVLKRGQRLTRFRRRGLKRVKVEFALHVLAYNLSRAVACIGGSLQAAFAGLKNVFLGRSWGPQARSGLSSIVSAIWHFSLHGIPEEGRR